MELKNIKAYPKLCLRILEDLKDKLPGHLTYHRLEHTLDVANVCDQYIEYYMISDRIASLIRVAAVGHDYGYIQGPEAHEERSIEVLEPILKKEYNTQELAAIAGMIRATKVPQAPKNLYEEIIADADLDYLGRGDYKTLSEQLYREFLHYGVVENAEDWLEVQIQFLEQHQYHTDWAIKHRAQTKEIVLDKLRGQKSREGRKVV